MMLLLTLTYYFLASYSLVHNPCPGRGLATGAA